MECALNHSMDYLLTRNIKHYPKKPNFVMTPEVFLTTMCSPKKCSYTSLPG